MRPTDAFGPNSLQGVVWDDIDPYAAGVSEDCLYLNVWTPAAPGDGARLSTMVWIHGGGFVAGSGAEPRYDGARLAARGIIVVTLNHRLNALGFLAHPELTAELEHRASGNYGLLDLVAALGWVKRNIAAFGGDPGQGHDRRRIRRLGSGERADGLAARQGAVRARHRRERGRYSLRPTRAPASLAKAEAAGVEFMRKVGARSRWPSCAPPQPRRSSPPRPGLGFRPIVDGWFLPRPPAEIFAAGEQSDVPLMAGWNKDEGFNFTLMQGPRRQARPMPIWRARSFGERTEEALQALLRAARRRLTPPRRPRSAATSRSSTRPGPGSRRRSEAAGADIFRFRFDRAPLTPEGWFGERASRDAGAFHAGEIALRVRQSRTPFRG